MTTAPAAWRALALEPPRAHGAALGEARLKVAREDFVVTERLGFAADGGAGHVLLRVEKRGIDTLRAARLLAAAGGVAARDVGFAGHKDRHAIATQWFTVPARRKAEDWVGEAGAEYVVREALPHSRKLRRGALRGNGFRVTLRGVSAAADALEARLAVLARRGVPNYFGPQRFGHDGGNLDRVARFAADGSLPDGREPRAFVYSAARALVFNSLLARRVVAGSWDRLLEGEYVNLAGRNSWFVATLIDATLEERLLRHDVHPTGPLLGRGQGPAGAAGALEAELRAEFATLDGRLAAAGVEAARRATRLVPEGLEWTRAGDALTLAFALPPGGYATVVVRELFAVEALAGEDSDD